MTSFMAGIVVVNKAERPIASSCFTAEWFGIRGQDITQVHHLSRRLQHHPHQILADIVAVSLDRSQDDRPPGLHFFALQAGFENIHAGMHGCCGLQDFGNEHLAVLEPRPECRGHQAD
jgi:hypothetical protein